MRELLGFRETMLTICYPYDMDEAYETVFLPFGKALKALRKMRKFTQHQLGELLNTDQTTISSWEHREEPLSDYDQMASLADILGVSIVDLEQGKVRRRAYGKPVRISGDGEGPRVEVWTLLREHRPAIYKALERAAREAIQDWEEEQRRGERSNNESDAPITA